MKRMRVGVIGAGFIGVAHIEALRRLGYTDVVALADSENAVEKAAALFVPQAYSDYREMIDREDLDAVHICTPNIYHYDMTMYAIKKGLGIVLEKPFAMSVEQAQKMHEAAQAHKTVTCLNHSLRMNPQVMQMKAMVEAGSVGDIYAVHGSYLQDWLYYDTDWSWRLESQISGKTRAYSDIGSHWVDMIEFITGQHIVELLAEFQTIHKTRRKPKRQTASFSGMALRPEEYEKVSIDTEDWCSILFRLESSAVGSVNISQVTAGRKNQQVINIDGSKCALHWDSENSQELWIGYREKFNQTAVKDPSILSSRAQNVISYPGGHAEGFPDTFKQQFQLFYTALDRKDAPGGDFAKFEDGLREMVINERVYESAQKRVWVKI